jgi:uncharacterized protein YqeY
MSLEQKIQSDYIAAMKAKDQHKSQFLSFIRAEIKNAAIDLKKRDGLMDEDVIVVLKKQKKRLEDARDQMATAGRQELVSNTEREIALVDEYLPQPLTEEELSAIVDAKIRETGAATVKDMGALMKAVLAECGGRADNKKVSEMVRSRLS